MCQRRIAAATEMLSNPVIEDVVNVAVLDEAEGAR